MKLSAGLVIFRKVPRLELLLVHPGGPFFVTKDLGSWSIPKGEYFNENPLDVAKREFTEETGNVIDDSKLFIKLSDVRLKSGKVISAWAVEEDFQTPFLSSTLFKLNGLLNREKAVPSRK